MIDLDIDLDALDGSVDLDALDAPAPTPAPTPVGTGRAHLDYAAPAEPEHLATPVPAGHFEQTAPSFDVDLDSLGDDLAAGAEGGLAALGGGDPLAGVDWNAAKANAPWAIPLVAGIGTAGASMPLQIGASLLAGGVGRNIGGEDTFKAGSLAPSKILEGGILPDLVMPILPNTVMGLGKGIYKSGKAIGQSALSKYADLTEALDDLTQGWDDLGNVAQTNATARPIVPKSPGQPLLDETRDFIGSPVNRGLASDIEELRSIAKRTDANPKARNRIQRFVTRTTRDIFTEPSPGARGKIGLRRTVPLSERQDLRLYMEGFKSAADVSPWVLQAEPKLRRAYGQLGDLAERWGLFKDAPRIKNYAGPLIDLPGQGDDVASLAEETATAHGGKRALKFRERKTHFDPAQHVTDAMEAWGQYSKSAPEKLAAAYSFGAPGAATSEGTREFGSIANELLNRAYSRALTPGQRATAESLTGSLKQIYHTGERSPGLGLAGQAIGTALLPSSWAAQVGQEAWNIARPGYQNTVEGLTRYALDPQFRGLIREGGARGGSLAHLFREIGEDSEGALADLTSKAVGRLPQGAQRGISWAGQTRLGKGAKALYNLLPDNMVGSAIGASESFLRGPGAAGYIPYAEDLIERALDEAGTSGALSRGLSRELAEAGLNADDFLNNSRWTPYQRSAHTLRNVHANMAGRYQLMAGDAGQSSARLIGTPAGRLFAQFKSFPLAAARLAKSDLIDPIWSGIKNRDMSELSLGAGRLARLVPAGIGMAGVSQALKDAAAGRRPHFDLGDSATSATKTIGGMPADLVMALLSATNEKTGEHEWGRGIGEAALSLLPPIADAKRIAGDKWPYLLGNFVAPRLSSAATMAAPYLTERAKHERERQAAIKKILSRR